LNLKIKPVQQYRIICFLLLLFIITPEFSVEGAHLRKVPVTLAQPSDFLANGTNGGLNISDIGSAGSTTSFPMVLSSATDCYVQDSGFEAGTPNPYWYEDSTNFGSPLCNTAYPSCSEGLAPGPHSGSWWAWFGGTGLREYSWVEQNVRFPAGGTATLDFYLVIPDAATPAYLRVFLDGNLLFEATEADADSYTNYSLVSLDVSAYADGGFHLLRFEATTEAGDITNFFVDDICVTVTTPNSTTTVIPLIFLLLLY
jgi:hypothetical protein